MTLLCQITLCKIIYRKGRGNSSVLYPSIVRVCLQTLYQQYRSGTNQLENVVNVKHKQAVPSCNIDSNGGIEHNNIFFLFLYISQSVPQLINSPLFFAVYEISEFSTEFIKFNKFKISNFNLKLNLILIQFNKLKYALYLFL